MGDDTILITYWFHMNYRRPFHDDLDMYLFCLFLAQVDCWKRGASFMTYSCTDASCTLNQTDVARESRRQFLRFAYIWDHQIWVPSVDTNLDVRIDSSGRSDAVAARTYHTLIGLFLLAHAHSSPR